MNLRLTFLVAFAAVSARASFHLMPEESAPVPVSQRFNFFDVELMRYAGEALVGNFMVSPASIKSSLAMLLEGANGKCAAELRRALRLPEDPYAMRQQLNDYFSSLRFKTPGIDLENANKIFISNKREVLKTYQKLLMDIYYSEIETVNFEDPIGTANSINNWVSKQTHGFINEVIDPFSLEASSVLILANAIYFKGTWSNSFDVENTHEQCFHTIDGCKDVYMMENQGNYNYGYIADINAQAIELPYQGGRYSMLLLLPDEQQGASALIKDLPFVSIPEILNAMTVSDVQISIPRFEIEFGDSIVSILQNVGINLVFTPRANLTGMVKGDLSPMVNNIYHKTRILVNEEGAIAAAASVIEVVPLMASSTSRFLAAHPFLFFIRDMKTGAVLFEGRVDEPTIVTKKVQQPSTIQHGVAGRPMVQQNNTAYYESSSQHFPSNNQQQSKQDNVQKPQSTKPENDQSYQYPPQQPNIPTLVRPNTNQATQKRPVQSQNYPPQANNPQPQMSSNQYPSTSTNQISQLPNNGYSQQTGQQQAVGTSDRFVKDDEDTLSPNGGYGVHNSYYVANYLQPEENFQSVYQLPEPKDKDGIRFKNDVNEARGYY